MLHLTEQLKHNKRRTAIIENNFIIFEIINKSNNKNK